MADRITSLPLRRQRFGVSLRDNAVNPGKRSSSSVSNFCVGGIRQRRNARSKGFGIRTKRLSGLGKIDSEFLLIETQ